MFSEPYALAFPVPSCNIPSISESKLTADRRLPVPVAVTGRIVSPSASTFPFDATKGQKLSISVQARQLGSLLDPVLAVEDNAGKAIKESDDINGGNQDSEIHLTIPSDGQYLARVSDRFQNFGDRYFYVLRCEETLSSFKATLASTAGTLRADKPLEIPISFNRHHGFAEPIDVKIEGLPEGVTFECPRSEKDGETSKTVTLKISGSTTEPFQGPVRIVAESAESNRLLAVVFTTGDLAETEEYWLTVPK